MQTQNPQSKGVPAEVPAEVPVPPANAPALPRSTTTYITPILCDVDPLGFVWHGNYFRYFEQARSDLLDSFNYGYRRMEESGFVWPIVETRCKYIAPVLLGRRIRIVSTLIEWEIRLRINYDVFDAETGARLTKAQTTQVAVRKDTRELCFASPPELLECLGVLKSAGTAQ
jgi:acyl-CoA thioester hydrolase